MISISALPRLWINEISKHLCVIFFHCISVLTDTTDGEDDLDKFLAGPLSQLSSNTVAPSTPYNSEAELSDNSRQLWGHDWATLHLLCINRIPDIFYWMKSTTKIKKTHFFPTYIYFCNSVSNAVTIPKYMWCHISFIGFKCTNKLIGKLTFVYKYRFNVVFVFSEKSIRKNLAMNINISKECVKLLKMTLDDGIISIKPIV